MASVHVGARRLVVSITREKEEPRLVNPKEDDNDLVSPSCAGFEVVCREGAGGRLVGFADGRSPYPVRDAIEAEGVLWWSRLVLMFQRGIVVREEGEGWLCGFRTNELSGGTRGN